MVFSASPVQFLNHKRLMLRKFLYAAISRLIWKTIWFIYILDKGKLITFVLEMSLFPFLEMMILLWIQSGIYMHCLPQLLLVMMIQPSLSPTENSSTTNPSPLASRFSLTCLGTILTFSVGILSGEVEPPSSSPVEELPSWSSLVEIGAASALQDTFTWQRMRDFSLSPWLQEVLMPFTV